MNTYYVKDMRKKVDASITNRLKHGKLVWRTIRILTDFRTADDWLMNYVSTSHYDMRDFTISTRPEKA